MAQKQHETPCADCPFRRSVRPGHLGNSPPEMYVGQACGPFWLPCHSTHEYKKLESRLDQSNAQCAGAAMFRANVGVSKLMPEKLLHLPANKNLVFATFAEFYAHHRRISVAEAEEILSRTTPEQHMQREWQEGLERAKGGKAWVEKQPPKTQETK